MMKRLIYSIVVMLFTMPVFGQVKSITYDITSKSLKLVIDKGKGTLISFKDLKSGEELLDKELQKSSSLFEIEIFHENGNKVINSTSAKSFRVEKSKQNTDLLIWSGFEGFAKDFSVVAEVSLDKSKSKSYWNLELKGIQGEKVVKVIYPKIEGIKDLGSEELAISDWMGALYTNPRNHFSVNEQTRLNYVYPGSLAMQFFTLYNPNKVGLLVATEDGESFAKDYVIKYEKSGKMGFELVNYPPFSDNLKTYRIPYPATLETFKGDWQDAAEIYAQWGRKQSWAKNARLVKGTIAPWVLDGSCWVWNRGRASNVLDPAMDLRKKLDLPVNVLWHWWHGGSYDDSFPDYFPPRDGAVFTDKVEEAKKHDVNAIIYMNQLKWGNSMPSWENEKAYLWSTKNIKGESDSHMYNIFTKKSLTYMCLATDFWKDKYAALVDSAVNKYKASGVYMDQACLSKVCYDPTHDHEPGGGNYWMKHVKERDILNRSKSNQPHNNAFAGEGGGEAWLPYLDGFLTLAVSKERYAGTKGAQTIPLFQAVYHEYGVSFGNYSSLLTPPYDEMWPKEFEPANAETLLDKQFNGQFLVEQARSFVWGMQPMIANYQDFLFKDRAYEMDFFSRMVKVRSQSLKYLLYGRYVKNIELERPISEFAMSKLSIYAGQMEKVTTFHGDYPTIYHGLWKAKDGTLGLSLASVQKQPFPVKTTLETTKYGLNGSGTVYKITEKGRSEIGKYKNGVIQVDMVLQPMEVCVIEFAGDKG